jgi:hypothetical protein
VKPSLTWRRLRAVRLAWMTQEAPPRWRWAWIEPASRLRAPNGLTFTLRINRGLEIAREPEAPAHD